MMRSPQVSFVVGIELGQSPDGFVRSLERDEHLGFQEHGQVAVFLRGIFRLEFLKQGIGEIQGFRQQLRRSEFEINLDELGRQFLVVFGGGLQGFLNVGAGFGGGSRCVQAGSERISPLRPVLAVECQTFGVPQILDRRDKPLFPPVFLSVQAVAEGDDSQNVFGGSGKVRIVVFDGFQIEGDFPGGPAVCRGIVFLSDQGDGLLLAFSGRGVIGRRGEPRGRSQQRQRSRARDSDPAFGPESGGRFGIEGRIARGGVGMDLRGKVKSHFHPDHKPATDKPWRFAVAGGMAGTVSKGIEETKSESIKRRERRRLIRRRDFCQSQNDQMSWESVANLRTANSAKMLFPWHDRHAAPVRFLVAPVVGGVLDFQKHRLPGELRQIDEVLNQFSPALSLLINVSWSFSPLAVTIKFQSPSA